MERYFDAFLYLANWETRRLMIRLPRGRTLRVLASKVSASHPRRNPRLSAMQTAEVQLAAGIG